LTDEPQVYPNLRGSLWWLSSGDALPRTEIEVATTAMPSRITTTTRAFPLAAYFVLAYGLSWLILVPAGLGLLPDSASVLAWLPPFGPAAAAFIA